MRLSAASAASTVRIEFTLLYYGVDICKYHILLKQRRVVGATGLMRALGRKKGSESSFCLCCCFALKQFKTGLAEVCGGWLTAFEACHVLSGHERGKCRR